MTYEQGKKLLYSHLKKRIRGREGKKEIDKEKNRDRKKEKEKKREK